MDGSVGIHVRGVDRKLGVVPDVDNNLVVGVDSVGVHDVAVGGNLVVGVDSVGVHDVAVGGNLVVGVDSVGDHDVAVGGNLVVGVDSVGDHICVVGCGLGVVHDVEVDVGVDGSIMLLVLIVLLVPMSRELVVNSLTQLLVTTKLFKVVTNTDLLLLMAPSWLVLILLLSGLSSGYLSCVGLTRESSCCRVLFVLTLSRVVSSMRDFWSLLLHYSIRTRQRAELDVSSCDGLTVSST